VFVSSIVRLLSRLAAVVALLSMPDFAATAVAQTTKPNILVIMGDDVGWFNIGAYHQGIMSGKTLIYNIRQDPFERTPSINAETLNNLGGGYMNDFYAREFWRFVLVQQRVADLAKTAIEYPPMQAPASFNLDAVKAQVEEAIKSHEGQ
jgi:hypothetical protein